MTTKTMKIGIASYDDFKARTIAIARGELKPGPDDPKVWFQSTESFAKVLSSRNRALLATIAETHPASLQELADKTGRKTSNLSRTPQDHGALRLRRAAQGCAGPHSARGAVPGDLA